MTQKRLLELGYKGFNADGKRDRPTVRAVMDFQVKHGITPNGVICERTFSHLNII